MEDSDSLQDPKTLKLLLQSPDATKAFHSFGLGLIIQWVAGSLLEYLQLAEFGTRNRNLSLAWTLSVINDPVHLRSLAGAFRSLSPISEAGIHTALIELLYAKAHLFESNAVDQKIDWLFGAVDALGHVPEFQSRGYEIAKRRLEQIIHVSNTHLPDD